MYYFPESNNTKSSNRTEMNFQAKPVETIYFELSKADQLKLCQKLNNQLHLIALAKFFCGFDYVRPFSAIKLNHWINFN